MGISIEWSYLYGVAALRHIHPTVAQHVVFTPLIL